MSLPASRRVRFDCVGQPGRGRGAVLLPRDLRRIDPGNLQGQPGRAAAPPAARPSFSCVELFATRQQAGRLVTQGVEGGTQSGQLIAARPLVQSLRHTTTLNTATDTFPAEKVLSTSTNTNSSVIHNERLAH